METATLISKIEDLINSELEILQHVSQCRPISERELVHKNYLINGTKISIDNFQEILKQLKMPKLSIGGTFQSVKNKRKFKIVGQGWDGEKKLHTWVIREIREVKHDGRLSIEEDESFAIAKGEMEERVKDKKIVVV